MSTALDMTSVIEREADKAVVCQTAGIKRASVQKRKEDKETMLRTEGLNIQASSLLVVLIICFSFLFIHAHTHTQPFNSTLSGTTWVGRYQKKHSPTHTHPDHRTSFITFLHLQRSMASSLFSLRASQSSRTTSLQVLFGLPLGLGSSTSYSMHFFTQLSSSFRSTCPYQCSLFCCNTNAISSMPSLSLSSLFGSLSFNLTPHIHLTILISARWSATTFSSLTGQFLLPCSMLLRTQLLFNLPFIIKDTSLLVSSVPAAWTYSNQF